MKKSVAETAETRSKIVEAAALEFRRNGISATGIAEVMKAAGLTQGGFYRHFESKQALVAEACAVGMGSVVEAARQSAEHLDPPRALAEIISRYLSLEHRSNCAEGCPVAALGSEIARNSSDTNQMLSEKIQQLTTIMEESLSVDDSGGTGVTPLAILAAMVGAVTVSRILTDETAAVAILDETRTFLVRASNSIT